MVPPSHTRQQVARATPYPLPLTSPQKVRPTSTTVRSPGRSATSIAAAPNVPKSPRLFRPRVRLKNAFARFRQRSLCAAMKNRSPPQVLYSDPHGLNGLSFSPTLRVRMSALWCNGAFLTGGDRSFERLGLRSPTIFRTPTTILRSPCTVRKKWAQLPNRL